MADRGTSGRAALLIQSWLEFIKTASVQLGNNQLL